MEMSRYGFKEYGFKIGLNNLILLTTMKLLKIKNFMVEYEEDRDFNGKKKKGGKK